MLHKQGIFQVGVDETTTVGIAAVDHHDFIITDYDRCVSLAYVQKMYFKTVLCHS